MTEKTLQETGFSFRGDLSELAEKAGRSIQHDLGDLGNIEYFRLYDAQDRHFELFRYVDNEAASGYVSVLSSEPENNAATAALLKKMGVKPSQINTWLDPQGQELHDLQALRRLMTSPRPNLPKPF